MPWKIHVQGILLFLFIPLVLFLFLQYPFGILSSILTGIGIMFAHRFVARPFVMRYRTERCLWCGRTSRRRKELILNSNLQLQCCENECLSNAKRFFDFANRHTILFRAGIFLPLVWYLLSMILIGLHLFSFPLEWNRFIFRFFIACSVVAVSFLYRIGDETNEPRFRFPIHNLFLLGIKNTLQVFRYVGFWWIGASLYFLYNQLLYVHKAG